MGKNMPAVPHYHPVFNMNPRVASFGKFYKKKGRGETFARDYKTYTIEEVEEMGLVTSLEDLPASMKNRLES